MSIASWIFLWFLAVGTAAWAAVRVAAAFDVAVESSAPDGDRVQPEARPSKSFPLNEQCSRKVAGP